MILPNFIIFGSIKSGTGALHQYLGHHPEIFMSSLKEPRFFTYDERSPKKQGSKPFQIKTVADYSRCFAGVTREIVIGEASSNYISSRAAARKIRQLIPNVKLLASLRNPADRAYAHYMMSRKDRTNIILAELTKENMGRSVTTSMYYENLKYYQDLFSPDQVKVLIFEEWTERVDSALKEVYEYLEVDSDFQLPSSVKYAPAIALWSGVGATGWLRRVKPYLPIQLVMTVNRLKSKVTRPIPELPAEMRTRLMQWYKDDVLKLQDLLDRDLSVWLEET